MRVRVKLFAAARDLACCDTTTVEVPDSATIAEVRAALLATTPALANIVPHALWAVDTEYATDNTSVTEESEIALIPPVSGG